jgi:hypothetical protein
MAAAAAPSKRAELASLASSIPAEMPGPVQEHEESEEDGARGDHHRVAGEEGGGRLPGVAAPEQQKGGRGHDRGAGRAQLEEPVARTMGHDDERGHEAEREMQEEEEEDRGHARTASMAARCGEAGANGS